MRVKKWVRLVTFLQSLTQKLGFGKNRTLNFGSAIVENRPSDPDFRVTLYIYICIM